MPEIDTAVVLAGGLAKRMLPLTSGTPKAMLAVAGRPFIEHQIELLKHQGVKRLVLCVAHLGEVIEKHVGNGSRFGIEVCYSHDGPRLLGTGGALRQALHLLPEVFFLTYGDSYLPCDWRRVASAFSRSGKPALMVPYENSGRWDTSNIWFAQGAIRAYDKKNPSGRMRHIDYGLAVITRDVVRAVPEHRVIDLSEIYAELIERNELAACEVVDRFYEIGSRQGRADLEAYLAPEELRS